MLFAMRLDEADVMIAIPTDSAHQAVGSRWNDFDSEDNFEYIWTMQHSHPRFIFHADEQDSVFQLNFIELMW